MPIGPQTLGDVVEPMPSRLATFKDPDTPDHIVLDQYSLTHFTQVSHADCPCFFVGTDTACGAIHAVTTTSHLARFTHANIFSRVAQAELTLRSSHRFVMKNSHLPQAHFISHVQYTLLGIPLPPSHSTPSLLCLSHESGKSVFLAFHTTKSKNRAMVSPGNEAGSLPWREQDRSINSRKCERSVECR